MLLRGDETGGRDGRRGKEDALQEGHQEAGRPRHECRVRGPVVAGGAETFLRLEVGSQARLASRAFFSRCPSVNATSTSCLDIACTKYQLLKSTRDASSVHKCSHSRGNQQPVLMLQETEGNQRRRCPGEPVRIQFGV